MTSWLLAGRSMGGVWIACCAGVDVEDRAWEFVEDRLVLELFSEGGP